MGEGLDIFDTVYDSDFRPSMDDAVSVLAFIFAPLRAFIGPSDNAEEISAARELLFEAKQEAVFQWQRSYAAKLDADRVLM